MQYKNAGAAEGQGKALAGYKHTACWRAQARRWHRGQGKAVYWQKVTQVF